MKIESAPYFNYSQKQTFKSVYPIYHWHNNGGIFMPVFDVPTAKKYQKQILGILNRTKHLCGKFSDEFINSVHENISEHDKDFDEEPCALSFYNYHSGIKTDWNDNIYEIKPCTYLITGSDALFFEKYFRRPIGYTKFDAKIYNNADDSNVKEAMLSYYLNGKDFVKQKERLFREENNSELHTIFIDDKPVKIRFYPKNGKENPFVKMGYYA